eukprot:8352049-Alexandrium_andersonii.AAC.1
MTEHGTVVKQAIHAESGCVSTLRSPVPRTHAHAHANVHDTTARACVDYRMERTCARENANLLKRHPSALYTRWAPRLLHQCALHSVPACTSTLSRRICLCKGCPALPVVSCATWEPCLWMSCSDSGVFRKLRRWLLGA